MKALFAILLALSTIALAGCNTVRGVGRDVEAAGEGLQHVSDEIQEEINE